MSESIKNLFVNFLFQSNCLECKTPLKNSHLLCPSCYNKFRKIILQTVKQCEKCGRPIAQTSNNTLCTECQNISFPYNAVKTLGFYEGTMKNLIHQFKFQQRWSLAKFFGNFIKEKKILSNTFFDYILPIPLSKERLLKRGYNQAELIAEQISTIIGSPTLKKILIRSRNTNPQSLLSKTERKHNLDNAFSIKIHEKYRHKHILLVDDVITTGTTITEASKILKKLKPRTITVFALAKAV